MPSNKQRLHVALYARGAAGPHGEDTYHWALLVTPRRENAKTSPAGARYHVTNTMAVPGFENPSWQFKTVELQKVVSGTLLVRITIAKVSDSQALIDCLNRVPVASYEGFTCRTWVAEAVKMLYEDAKSLGTKVPSDWQAIEDQARRYARAKKDVGRWREGTGFDINMPATFSMLENKELIP